MILRAMDAGEVVFRWRVARSGGEKIAVMLPATGMANAVLIAERICKKIAAAPIEHEFNVPWRVATASIGVATIGRDRVDSRTSSGGPTRRSVAKKAAPVA